MATQRVQSLEAVMAASLKQYDKGDASWFSHLARDATVYAIGTAAPFIGKEAYEAHFSANLSSAKRKTQVLDQRVKYLNDATAVVTQTLQVTQAGVTSVVRQSVVWALGDAWQIRHLHSALVGTPTGVKTPTTVSGIRVLNERIATVAAVLGVAQ